MGTKLPRKLEQKMQIVGEQIKLARLRRNLSVAQVAERATCSPLTVSRIEKGIPGDSSSSYKDCEWPDNNPDKEICGRYAMAFVSKLRWCM